MSKVKIKLNSRGVREVLKSEELKTVCEDKASEILNRCGNGYTMNSMIGKNRVNAMVYADTIEAKRDNLKNNTLLKAVR